MNRILKKGIQRTRVVHNYGYLLLLSAVMGVIGGLGALLFTHVLHLCLDFFMVYLGGLKGYQHTSDGLIPKYLFFLIPTAGGLISGFLAYKFAPEVAGDGTYGMIETFHKKKGKIRKRVPFFKSVTSIVTISTGGSAGYEGPIAQIGSGLGFILSKWFKMPIKFRRIIVLSGTAAGLGAIFKAPLGGALTSTEVLYKEDFESEAFLTCIISSAIGYTVYTAFVGHASIFGELPVFEMRSPIEVLFYVFLGLICAPISFFYVKTYFFMKEKFEKLNIKNYYKPAIGGLLVGLLFYIRPEIIGSDWAMVTSAIDGSFFDSHTVQSAIIIFLVVGFLKIIATGFTMGSGGSGGVFGPSLFIGAMVGGLVGTALELIFPNIVTQPETYVVVGMGAFFAGAANAPVASVIMVCEITGNYNLLTPLMIASTIHIYLGHKYSIYPNQVKNKFYSSAHKTDMNVDVLNDVTIKDISSNLVENGCIKVNASATLKELESILTTTEDDIFAVIDDQEKYVGLLDVHSIRNCLFDTYGSHLYIVEDMMGKPLSLSIDTNLHAALQYFLKYRVNQIPVLNYQQEIIGTLKHDDISSSYHNSIRKLQHEDDD